MTDQHGEQVSLSDFCGNTVLMVASVSGAVRVAEASDLEGFVPAIQKCWVYGNYAFGSKQSRSGSFGG